MSATDNVEKAIARLAAAWNVPGPHPGYHGEQKELLRKYWPTLYSAVEALLLARAGACACETPTPEMANPARCLRCTGSLARSGFVRAALAEGGGE